MQNKFTKGILERQEREYKNKKTLPTVQEPAPPDIQEPEEKALPVQIPAETPPPTSNPAALPDKDPQDILSAYIVRDSGRKAKNKTFYLDGAVIQAIRRAASAQHIPESKLVNDILKKILIPSDGTH